MELTALTWNVSTEKLKCGKCKNYLSHFPIRMCSNNQNICGRCIAPEEELVFQNIAYETLSQFLKFPCCYKDEGCEEELQPKNVPGHEKICRFRNILCPSRNFTRCEWKGPRLSMLQHCQTEHCDIITNGEIAVSFVDSDNNHLFIIHDKLLLIFKWRFDFNRKLLFFELYTNEFELHVKKFTGQLSANSANKNLSMSFTTTSFDEIVINELSLESIMSISTNVVLKLTLGEVVEDPDKVVNLEMLALLKCGVCSRYAVPPIHHCVQSSSTLCSECQKTHNSYCEGCSRSNSSSRNINLDKLASLLNYPCRYQQNGCAYISKPDKIKIHESGCELGDFECPVDEFENCVWKGPWKELEQHIQNNHQELVTNAALLSKQLQPQRMKCDIIKFSNQLFRLVSLRTNEDKYMWSVQTIGAPKEDFKYEIEVRDPLNKGRRLLVRQQCGTLTKSAELFQHSDKFCYFMRDQIQDFIFEQVIQFRINIFV